MIHSRLIFLFCRSGGSAFIHHINVKGHAHGVGACPQVGDGVAAAGASGTAGARAHVKGGDLHIGAAVDGV